MHTVFAIFNFLDLWFGKINNFIGIGSFILSILIWLNSKKIKETILLTESKVKASYEKEKLLAQVKAIKNFLKKDIFSKSTDAVEEQIIDLKKNAYIYNKNKTKFKKLEKSINAVDWKKTREIVNSIEEFIENL
ncbi:hypothetical protein CIRMBP1307_00779 [Enterococcus cecorum]|uniref:hypothetical protein n=1 Tax=Enterococcus cecorum TaxID=44008 RepID=UPI000B121F90|nr:hypothetical protein [Enterococcus cecorum]CAI3384395.1 hypothetical protein CIRMBP1307_00779 [Enterococcus cecorum]